MTFEKTTIRMSTWISCYDSLPEHKAQVIFRTDHEGVWAGRFYKNIQPEVTGVYGTFRALTESFIDIGWICRTDQNSSEVHEWMPLPA